MQMGSLKPQEVGSKPLFDECIDVIDVTSHWLPETQSNWKGKAASLIFFFK